MISNYQILGLVGVFTEFEKCGDTRSVEAREFIRHKSRIAHLPLFKVLFWDSALAFLD